MSSGERDIFDHCGVGDGDQGLVRVGQEIVGGFSQDRPVGPSSEFATGGIVSSEVIDSPRHIVGVVVLEQSGDLPSRAQRSAMVASELRRRGFDTILQLPFVVGVVGTRECYERELGMRFIESAEGDVGRADVLGLPASVAGHVVDVCVGGELEVFEGGWPDPTWSFITNALYDDGEPVYAFGPDFGTGGLTNVLFQSDVLRLLGVDWAHKQNGGGGKLNRGYGVDAYLVDSGIDLSHPLFQGARATAGFEIDLLPETILFPGVTPGLDLLGHGTMCAAAFLAVAPEAALHVLSCPSSKPNMVPAWVLNLSVAVAMAVQTKPSVVSTSWGVNLLVNGVPTGPDNVAACKAIDAAVRFAAENDVLVVSASGNKGLVTPEGFQLQYAPVPACLPDVLSVGGAYPSGLECGLVPDCWTASDYANSGTALYPSFTGGGQVARPFPDLCSIVNMQAGNTLLVPWSTNSASGIVEPGSGEILKGWRLGGGTSFATPTVAGICSLLMQKYLTPGNLPPLLASDGPTTWKSVVLSSDYCVDVREGKTWSMGAAATGQDVATGLGVLSAKKLISRVDAKVYDWMIDRASFPLEGVPQERAWPPL